MVIASSQWAGQWKSGNGSCAAVQGRELLQCSDELIENTLEMFEY
jgi:hypothetical protein